MLKFFRKYNKWILAIGVSLLMVAFLIQPFLSSISPTGRSTTLGRINGKKVTWSDYQETVAQIKVLEGIPLVNTRVRELVGQDATRWMLMLHDAERLGLSASDAEVDDVIAALGIQPQFITKLLKQVRGYKTEDFRRVIRNWLTVEQYYELVSGQIYQTYDTPQDASPLPAQTISSPGLKAINQIYIADQFARQGNYGRARELAYASMGSQRISEPLIKHFLYERMATVEGKFLLIDSEDYIDPSHTPSEQELTELFEQYKENLPGESQPYGFGYHLPDRIKIEYMTIPIDQITERIDVDEAEVLDYYETNQDQFKNQNNEEENTQPPIRPYQEVRQQIIDQLTRQKTEQLATKMVNSAQAILFEDSRDLKEDEEGYRDIPDSFQPKPMQEVIEELEKTFEIRPELTEATDDWLTLEQAGELPGIGSSRLANRRDFSFTDYLKSAKELEPGDDNELIHLRLQVKVPSMPLTSYDGSYYMFRMTSAEADRTPENIDEVKENVLADAQTLAAYNKLINDKENILAIAVADDLDTLAEAKGTEVNELPPTARTTWGYMSKPGPPTVTGVGASQNFIDAIFNVVDKSDDPTNIKDIPEDQRMGVVEIDEKLALAVFLIETYKPITYKQYKDQVESAWTPIILNMVLSQNMEETDNPLYWKAIADRVGFKPARDETEEQTDEDQTPTTADASE